MSRENSEDHYKQVAEELQAGTYDQDLWENAYNESNGDEARAMLKYKMLRVKRLSGKEDAQQKVLNTSSINPASEFERIETQPPVHQQKNLRSFLIVTFLYCCLYFGLSYVSWVLNANLNIAAQQEQKIREAVIGNSQQLINEWQKLRHSRSFKQLNKNEKKQLEEQYAQKMLKAREAVNNLEPPDQTSQRIAAEFGMISLILLVQIASLFVVWKFSGHLKLGCVTTFFLLIIPVFGWIALIYLGFKNNCREDPSY